MKFYVRVLLLLVLCVLVPCVTVLAATNYFTLAQYQEAVSNSQVDRLRAAASTNALVVENIEQGALRFSLEPAVQTLGGLTNLDFGPGNNEYLAGLLRTQRMLAEFVSTNELLDSVYLYIDESNYIVTSRDGIVTMDRFTDLGWRERYDALRQDRRAHRMLPAREVSARYSAGEADSYSLRYLTYVYPITPFTSTFHGALVFNIREEALLELYMGHSSDSNIAIFDDEGNWLTGVSSVDYSPVLEAPEWGGVFPPEGADTGYFFSNAENKRLQCTHFRSDDGRYVLLAVQDIKVLTEKTTSLQVVFVVFLAVFIPFVALLVLVISRRLYSPIGKLVKELHSGGITVAGGEKDALSAISRAVNELLREDHRLFSDLGREKLRDATGLRILAGNESGAEDEDFRAILPYSHNICAVCAPDAPLSQRRRDENYDSRIRLLVRLIEKELAGEGLHPTTLRYDENTIVVILSVDDSVADLEEVLRARFARIQPEALAVMGDTVTFAVGSLREELAGVRQCFEQAKNMLQYRFIIGLGSILFYDRLYIKAGHYSADERLRFIQHCLGCGKKEETLQGITELIADIKATPDVSYICVSQVLGQLVTLLTQYTIDHDIRLEELTGDNTPIYRRLWQNRTLDEALGWFHGIYAAAIDYQNVGNAPSGEYMGKILEYVRENYCRDITIDSIADYIGISYSYLRKLFKEATGRNLADYIGELRISKAKQLLCETNYTVKTIAQMCGFNHERSFSRAFTQSEGMSPGKFKGAHRPG